MISNRLWKMILVTSVLLLAALLLASPRLKVNAEEEAPSMPQQVTHRFYGHTPVTPLVELAVSQYFSSIAVDGAGNAYAIWTDYRNGNADIYFSHRLVGGSWSANVKVNNDTSIRSQSRPAIAVDNVGNAFAVWIDDRNGNSDLYFAYRPVNGAWGANVRVDDAPGTSSMSRPDIAVDWAGNAYAVWRDSRNGDDDIYFAYRPAGGAWGANVRVNDDIGSEAQNNPAIAVDGSGNAHTIWEDERNLNAEIYSAYRPSGGNWGINELVNITQICTTIKRPILTDAAAMLCRLATMMGVVFTFYRPSGGIWGAKSRSVVMLMVSNVAVDASDVMQPGETWDENVSDVYSAFRPTGRTQGSPALIDGSWLSIGVRRSDEPDGQALSFGTTIAMITMISILPTIR
jgi:hypothetical protein